MKKNNIFFFICKNIFQNSIDNIIILVYNVGIVEKEGSRYE